MKTTVHSGTTRAMRGPITLVSAALIALAVSSAGVGLVLAGGAYTEPPAGLPDAVAKIVRPVAGASATRTLRGIGTSTGTS